MRTLVLAVCAAGCLAEPAPVSRELCYQAAEARAQARVDRECGGNLDGCEAAPEIVRGLELELSACL